MKENLSIKDSKRSFSSIIRLYPQQILGVIVFLVLLTVGFGLVLPTHGQTRNFGQSSYADLVDKVSPAVVTVRAEKKVTADQSQQQIPEELRKFFGNQLPQGKQGPQIERGLGSGVIVESNGVILTNNHVVEGASQLKVDLPDKRSFDAKVIGTDPASDLAVIKIEATGLPTVPVGDSDKVRVGDVVLAFGNPLGLRQTVTSGIISAKGRQTGLSDGSFEDFLQTDAAINQGNSGGALVNVNGELVGINSQILSPSGGSIGIGFAIPSDMAKSVMAQLMNGGKVHRGMLGVGIQDVNSDLAENFGLKEIRGVIVNSVTPASPADKAGLKQGDVILTLNGSNINDGNELRNKVAQTAPGSSVTIGFTRDGKAETAQVALGEFQSKNEKVSENVQKPDPTSGKLGLSLQPLTPQLSNELGLKGVTSGLVVGDVTPGSPADEAGIAEGDVIVEVNRQPVKTVEQVKFAESKAKAGSILMLINRGGQTIFVTVKE